MKIKEIRLNTRKDVVYDIETPTHDYILANGVVSHNTMDQYRPLEAGGGQGLFYSCSSIVMGTSKAKDKDADGDISGSIITATTHKGRFCKEHSKLKYLIQHNGGIHPFYGILEDALGGGYVTKPSMGWYTRPSVENDKKWREAEIWKNSEEFWMPIIKNTDFNEYIESIYRFTGEINDTDFTDEDFDEVDTGKHQAIPESHVDPIIYMDV